MSNRIRHTLTAAAAIGAAALAGTAIAGAASDPSPSDTRGGGRPNETALTGATAAKVKQAALAKVSGTVLRVETDEGGVYEAHIRKSDGTEVEVKVDKAFNVTAVEEHDRQP